MQVPTVQESLGLFSMEPELPDLCGPENQNLELLNTGMPCCMAHFSSLCFTGEMFSYKLKVRLPTSKDITAHCIGTAWNRTPKISEVGLCSVTITTGMKCPETANLAIKSETKKRSFFLLRHKH